MNFGAFNGRRCRSLICWEEVGDRRIYRSDLIQETAKKIKILRKRMRSAQSRQKAYADHYRRPLKFSVSDKVFPKASPIKRVLCINRKSKLDL